MTGRRKFIQTIVSGTAAIGLINPVFAKHLSNNKSGYSIHVFTKCLQFLNFNELAEVLARIGFRGADLAVRPGGQILPENVETDLPKAIKALNHAGISSEMITTQINSAEDKYTRRILRTMADQGIRYYRMGYLRYDDSKTIINNLEEHKYTFEKLEKLNREYDVHGGYQNHSGKRVGGPVWDLYFLLRDRNPEYIGVQYDIRHAVVEGGVSWPIGMKLLSPWIKTTDIKDFVWEKSEKGGWKTKNVPLGKGMVNFDEFFNLYKLLEIEAPISVHYEYDLGGAENGSINPSMSKEEIFSLLKIDLDFINKKIMEFNL